MDIAQHAWWAEKRPPPVRLAYCPILHEENRRALAKLGIHDEDKIRRLCDAGFDCASCGLFWQYVDNHVNLRWLCPVCARSAHALGFYTVVDLKDSQLMERQCDNCQEWFPLLIACRVPMEK